MPCFIQRSACNADKPPIVLKAAAPTSLGNVGADTIDSTNQLFANGIFCKSIPRQNNDPQFIRKPFGKLINLKLLKRNRRQNYHQ